MAYLLALLTVLASLSAPAEADNPAPSPDPILVSVSIRPITSEALLIPRDRTDKQAYVAEVLLVSAEKTGLGSNRIVLFPGEPKDGSFTARDLEVTYRFEMSSKGRRVKSLVRVRRSDRLVAAHSSEAWLVGAVPGKGVEPAE